MFSSLVFCLKFGVVLNFLFCLILRRGYFFLWIKEIIVEGLTGKHTLYIVDMLKFCFSLFIFSEVIFFFRVFWVFFDRALSPALEEGETWPPSGVSPLNPFRVPLLNTVILLSSGVLVTWAHHSLLTQKKFFLPLLGTIILAILFERVQYFEYTSASFSVRDGLYGSIFYFSTGFHGIHVLVGTCFLIYNLWRTIISHFSPYHHFGFEASILYWHFVDVVWLFLYVFIYWWSA